MIKRYKDFVRKNEEFFFPEENTPAAEDKNAENAIAEEENEEMPANETEETEEEGGNDLDKLARMLKGEKANESADEASVSGNEIHYKGMVISKPSETNTFHLAIDDHFIDLNTEDAEAAKNYIDAYQSGDIKIEDLKALKRKRVQAQAQKNESRFVSHKKK